MNHLIPNDVRSEVLKRFLKMDQEFALEIIAEFDGPRLMRCAVHFSNGDIERLWRALDIAQKDYRDLIFWTEYDGLEKRVRDFNSPFSEAMILE